MALQAGIDQAMILLLTPGLTVLGSATIRGTQASQSTLTPTPAAAPGQWGSFEDRANLALLRANTGRSCCRKSWPLCRPALCNAPNHPHWAARYLPFATDSSGSIAAISIRALLA